MEIKTRFGLENIVYAIYQNKIVSFKIVTILIEKINDICVSYSGGKWYSSIFLKENELFDSRKDCENILNQIIKEKEKIEREREITEKKKELEELIERNTGCENFVFSFDNKNDEEIKS